MTAEVFARSVARRRTPLVAFRAFRAARAYCRLCVHIAVEGEKSRCKGEPAARRARTPGGDQERILAEGIAGEAAIVGMGTPARGAPGFAPAPAPSGGGGSTDNIGEFERLAKLRDSGALTDAEFEREKAKILGG
jgi:hypothetical protein